MIKTAGNIDLQVRRMMLKYYNPIWEQRKEKAHKLLQNFGLDVKIKEEYVPDFKYDNMKYYDDHYGYYQYFLLSSNDESEQHLVSYLEKINKNFDDAFFKLKYKTSDGFFIKFLLPTSMAKEKEFKQIALEKEQQNESRRDKSQEKKEKQLLNIDKKQALENAKNEVIKNGIIVWDANEKETATLSRKDEYEKYEKSALDTIAQHWGINPDELEHYVLQSNESKKQVLRDKVWRDSIINLTLSRLPRVIKNVVEKVPVIIKIDSKFTYKKRGHYRSSTRNITLWISSLSRMPSIVSTLAHEYWHAFEYLSGFKESSEKYFQHVIDSYKQNPDPKTVEDFKRAVEILDEYGNHDYKTKMTVKWGKEYFNRQHYELLDEIEKDFKNPHLYQMMSEILADTLASIAIGKGNPASELLLTWMNQKFAHRDEIIIKNAVKHVLLKNQTYRNYILI